MQVPGGGIDFVFPGVTCSCSALLRRTGFIEGEEGIADRIEKRKKEARENDRPGEVVVVVVVFCCPRVRLNNFLAQPVEENSEKITCKKTIRSVIVIQLKPASQREGSSVGTV